MNFSLGPKAILSSRFYAGLLCHFPALYVVALLMIAVIRAWRLTNALYEFNQICTFDNILL